MRSLHFHSPGSQTNPLIGPKLEELESVMIHAVNKWMDAKLGRLKLASGRLDVPKEVEDLEGKYNVAKEALDVE